jgi:hypothetical protein
MTEKDSPRLILDEGRYSGSRNPALCDCLTLCYFCFWLSSRSAFRWSWAGFIFAP